MKAKDYKKSFDGERNTYRIFERFPYNPELKEKAKVLRKNMTFHEKYLWYNHLSKHKIRFQKQKIIDNYIVDFYCAKAGLVIEIDGDSHFWEGAKGYDNRRTMALERYGLKVLRFYNLDIEINFEAVCKIIDDVVLKNTP